MSADTSSPKHGLASRRPKASPEDEALVGRTLAGRYRIEERVASGGMGVVYRAEQQPLGRPVALKVLKPPGDDGMKRQFTERFLLEAASMAQLQHPNTVVVHDFGESEGTLYFTMEFLAGETLTQRVRRVGPLEPEDAIHVAVQIASSLGDAHATGLVHRDLKPGNVMLLERGGDRLFVKVLDFGLVKLVGSDAKQQLTQSGIILGSPRYMAPEQVRGQSLGPAADVYAFGCLLTFLLTAQPPFPKGGPFEAMRAHVYEEPPGLRDLDPHCIAGERLEAVVARCLHKEPEARFGTMAELADALRHAALAPRVAASSALDLQVTFQRASAPSDAPAGDEAGPKQTTPLGAAPLPSLRALPPASRPPAGPGRAPLGAPTLPDGSGAPAASLAPPVEETSSGWSAAFGDATQAWRRFRVRILLAAAAMIALVGVVSLALFLPGGPLGVPLPPEPRTVAPAAAEQRPEARATPAPAPAPDPAAAAAAAPPRSRSVRIDSEPAGAEVLRDGVVLGDTPLVLDVPEDARWTLVLMRAGYEARTVTIAGASPERAVPSAARELRVTLLEAEAGSRRGRPRSGRVPGAATATESPGADAPEGVAADTAPAGADTRPRTQTIRDPWER